ncbi:MAG: FAD-binding oxidoreductase, partial [Rhodospirillaceae bacterium]|nr:FAD-binding oxidoreductase [Rhodospirillaceae bacterium]
SLAKSLDRDWGYRRVDTLSVIASTRRNVGGYRNLPSPAWLGEDAAVYSQIGTPETTAQINPAAFTNAIMDAAIDGGAKLVNGSVEGVELTPGGDSVTGAIVDGAALAGDVVVIAMGPWSVLACQWLPLPPTGGAKGHSLVFDYDPSPESLFVELENDDGEMTTPEINPRPDGTTYICGLPGDDPLPVDPALVIPESGASEKLRQMAARISPELGASKVLAEQSCYRPVTTDGLPLIGPVPGIAGAYVATGHNVWGMLNAPATGEAMAELIVGGAATTVDLHTFNPARLTPLKSSGG